jgi:hypothetical protein
MVRLTSYLAPVLPVSTRREVHSMQTLEKVLQQAQQSGVAIGHFNISDLVLLKAVFAAGKS